jgi:hypothetical protein
MNTDKAPTNLTVHWTVEGGDTCGGRVEHRSSVQLSHSHMWNR